MIYAHTDGFILRTHSFGPGYTWYSLVQYFSLYIANIIQLEYLVFKYLMFEMISTDIIQHVQQDFVSYINAI